jgi:chromosome segregation ATPase
VVETVMYFALGFLAAALIALLIIPAINARADRLARRRAEAMFPLSISELTAEKDHLRAEFAVLQRRTERRAEEALSVKHRSMEELGRRAVRIEALETELAERDSLIADLRTSLTEAATRLVAAEEELTSSTSAGSGLRDTLGAIEDAHRRTLDELARTRGEVERLSATLASTKTELALTQDRLEIREAEFADLEARHRAVLGDLDTKRITISDLGTRLGLQTDRSSDFERSLADRRRELSEERERLAEFARALLAEQERAAALERRIEALESEHDGTSAEAAALTDRLQRLSGENGTQARTIESLEKELDASRARIAALEIGRSPHGVHAEAHRAENAELRRLIVEVADDMIRSVENQARASHERRKARG